MANAIRRCMLQALAVGRPCIRGRSAFVQDTVRTGPQHSIGRGIDRALATGASARTGCAGAMAAAAATAAAAAAARSGYRRSGKRNGGAAEGDSDDIANHGGLSFFQPCWG